MAEEVVGEFEHSPVDLARALVTVSDDGPIVPLYVLDHDNFLIVNKDERRRAEGDLESAHAGAFGDGYREQALPTEALGRLSFASVLLLVATHDATNPDSSLNKLGVTVDDLRFTLASRAITEKARLERIQLARVCNQTPEYSPMVDKGTTTQALQTGITTLGRLQRQLTDKRSHDRNSRRRI